MQDAPWNATGLFRENKIVVLNMFKHRGISESFKYFAKHWKKRN